MRFKGIDLRDMTDEEIEKAEEYTANAIAETHAHLDMLKTGYRMLGEEILRRGNLGADKSLN